MRLIEKQFVIAGVVTLVITTCVILILIFANRSANPQPFPLLALVFLSGCIGGTTNHYRRLQQIPDNDEQVRAKVSQTTFLLQALVSPVLGGIFAVAAYLIFAGKLLEGPFFPAFKDTDSAYEGLLKFFDVTPAKNIDVAKMLVWGFVSGFSERFVPNLLDKFSQNKGK